MSTAFEVRTVVIAGFSRLSKSGRSDQTIESFEDPARSISRRGVGTGGVDAELQ
jgi:hypothetical protein